MNMQNKTALRNEYKAKRDAMAEAQRISHSATIAAHLLPLLKQASCIASYHPIGSEVDVFSTLNTHLDAQHLCLPVINGDRLTFHHLDAPFVPHPSYNIPEPVAGSTAQPEIILVPAVALDIKRNRLGYGGGYYDRSLPYYPNATTIGVGFAAQLVPEGLPAEAHDVLLSGIVTEQGLQL